MSDSERGVRHVFVDLETTGLDPERDVITEMAWRFRKDAALHVKHYYVDYEGFPSLWAARHTSAMQMAPKPEVALKVALTRFFGDCLKLSEDGNADVYLVGANPAFDHGFLAKQFREVPYHFRLIDVEAMAMGAFGWSAPRPLNDLRAALGIPGENERPHDASHDAREAQLVFEALLARQTSA